MKTIFMIIILLIALIPNGNIRYETAVVTGTCYDNEECTNIIYLATSDGNGWAIYDTTMPVGTKCVVKFDAKDNENIYDDEIINITWL